GFYCAWRRLARHDRRLKRLAGPQGMAWLEDLTDRPVEALEAAFARLGIGDEGRRDALRELIACLPGWASFAHWRDESASFDDQEGPPFRLLDLVTVLAVSTAAVTAPGAA